MNPPGAGQIWPGDECLPQANLTFDRSTTIPAGAPDIWPWLVQLGKRRAGWYLPAALERMLPAGRRASRVIEPRWQSLQIGDRVPDYGGRDEYLEVVSIEPERWLVYRSQRRGTEFTWALLLSPVTPRETELRWRFRGQLKRTGWRSRALVTVGDLFDWATGELMLRGLTERLAGRR